MLVTEFLLTVLDDTTGATPFTLACLSEYDLNYINYDERGPSVVIGYTATGSPEQISALGGRSGENAVNLFLRFDRCDEFRADTWSTDQITSYTAQPEQRGKDPRCRYTLSGPGSRIEFTAERPRVTHLRCFHAGAL